MRKKQGCEEERLVNHQQGGSTMCKAFRKQEGFTLIELMIVVAIIGILAAIAIPNFLQYQMKSRQAEAKTNLGAIRTSEISFQAERSCYLAVSQEGALPAAAGTKTLPVAWGLGNAAVLPNANGFCNAGGTFLGTFKNIGFVSTGSTLYSYAINETAVAVPVPACALGIVEATGAVVGAMTGFNATAGSNLDGDAFISVWAASADNGATDCSVGVF
jgi:type IV pilus assembly protein PilA